MNVYEERLRSEYLEMSKIPKNKEVRDVIQIYYKNRNGGDYHPISEQPSCALYPNEFKVIYTFKTMYVRPGGKSVKNWRCTVYLTFTENVLIGNSGLKVQCNFENGCPFCHHIQPGFICIGSLWTISKPFGIWYFLLMLGGLFNYEKFCVDPNSTHLDDTAYKWWKDKRKMRPNNDIKWPFDLNQQKGHSLFKIGKVTQMEKKPLFVVRKR